MDEEDSFDQDPIIELKERQEGVNLRKGGMKFDFKKILLNKESS
jgi:hypothetical protein